MTNEERAILGNILYFLGRAPALPGQNDARLAAIDWTAARLNEPVEEKPDAPIT